MTWRNGEKMNKKEPNSKEKEEAIEHLKDSISQSINPEGQSLSMPKLLWASAPALFADIAFKVRYNPPLHGLQENTERLYEIIFSKMSTYEWRHNYGKMSGEMVRLLKYITQIPPETETLQRKYRSLITKPHCECDLKAALILARETGIPPKPKIVLEAAYKKAIYLHVGTYCEYDYNTWAEAAGNPKYTPRDATEAYSSIIEDALTRSTFPDTFDAEYIKNRMRIVEQLTGISPETGLFNQANQKLERQKRCLQSLINSSIFDNKGGRK